MDITGISLRLKRRPDICVSKDIVGISANIYLAIPTSDPVSARLSPEPPASPRGPPEIIREGPGPARGPRQAERRARGP